MDIDCRHADKYLFSRKLAIHLTLRNHRSGPTPAGMNFSAIIRPPSGVTRSSPVALVGLTRIVSLSTAFSTGSFSTEAKSATHSERSSLGKVSANSFFGEKPSKMHDSMIGLPQQQRRQ